MTEPTDVKSNDKPTDTKPYPKFNDKPEDDIIYKCPPNYQLILIATGLVLLGFFLTT